MTVQAQVIEKTLTHDNLEREYILYVPDSYTGTEAVPLVFNFHGFTSNATEQMFYGDFRVIADTANFIIAHPMGTLLGGNTHFNVGGFTLGSTTDDVGFTAAMIDSISADYNINLDRVYSTGMSNGGFMSFLLACQLSDKFAAIASVTGSMTPETFNNCDPQHPTPVLQIHGTDDSVVPYDGAPWTKSVEDAVNYWVNFNDCDTEATAFEIEDISTIDGSTAEHFTYENGENGVTTEHIKITGGDHTWPGTAFVFPGTNLDFNASLTIWEFFAQYDINGAIDIVSDVDELTTRVPTLAYPNPVNDVLIVDVVQASSVNYALYSSLGELMIKGKTQQQKTEIEVSDLPIGVYFLQVEGEVLRVLKQ